MLLGTSHTTLAFQEYLVRIFTCYSMPFLLKILSLKEDSDLKIYFVLIPLL